MPESQPVEIATISREELKEKIDRKDRFVLVETLPANYYNHDHLPGAINLPPDQIAQLAPKSTAGQNGGNHCLLRQADLKRLRKRRP